MYRLSKGQTVGVNGEDALGRNIFADRTLQDLSNQGLILFFFLAAMALSPAKSRPFMRMMTSMMVKGYGDVRIAPLAPTVTSLVPIHVTARRLHVIPGVRDDHLTPSGEVRMVLVSPTATIWLPAQNAENRLHVVPEV